MELLNNPIFWITAALFTLGIGLYAIRNDRNPRIIAVCCGVAIIADLCYAIYTYFGG